MQDDRLPVSLTAINGGASDRRNARMPSARRRGPIQSGAPHLQRQRIGWSVNDIYWQRLRCELRQQFLQSARAQMFVDLVRKHANNADTGQRSLNGSLCRVDREFEARLDGEGRAVPAVSPFRGDREALEAYAIMRGRGLPADAALLGGRDSRGSRRSPGGRHQPVLR